MLYLNQDGLLLKAVELDSFGVLVAHLNTICPALLFETKIEGLIEV
jgi:hypothetical protein